MKEIFEKDRVLLEGLDSFELDHTLDCGQSFRWKKLDSDRFEGVAYGRPLLIEKISGDFVLHTSMEDYISVWKKYFDLERDYSAIKENFRADPTMAKAIEFGRGIRLLRQEPFETLISFIISANNRIPMIKRVIDFLSTNYGEQVNYKGKVFYAFPKPDALARVPLEELMRAKAGFRTERIIEVSRLCSGGYLELERLYELSYLEARNELMKLKGVGGKIADCVLLFAYAKGESFPVDVWVKRVMEHFYLKEDTRLDRIGDIAREMYGDLAGIAQQYLFYYAKDCLGREKFKEAKACSEQ